jgi:hypothetical protein
MRKRQASSWYLPVQAQPRRLSENGVSGADESSEDKRLPALRSGGWLRLFFILIRSFFERYNAADRHCG